MLHHYTSVRASTVTSQTTTNTALHVPHTPQTLKKTRVLLAMTTDNL